MSLVFDNTTFSLKHLLITQKLDINKMKQYSY